MTQPDLHDETDQLRASIETFTECLAALPADVFLRPVTAWSPRDVVAHLIGWNVYTLEGCRDLQQGKAPAYLSDAANDFAHVNAASVQRYAATDRDLLLDQLRSTADALLRYLQDLAPEDWNRDFGVREADGQPARIHNDIEALTADYLGHAREVAAWAQLGRTTH